MVPWHRAAHNWELLALYKDVELRYAHQHTSAQVANFQVRLFSGSYCSITLMEGAMFLIPGERACQLEIGGLPARPTWPERLNHLRSPLSRGFPWRAAPHDGLQSD